MLDSWGLSPLPLSGPVNSDVMPNGNGLAEGFDTAGDTLPLTAPLQSTSSPVNSQNREPSPGVAAYPPMMLEKSEGASAEVTVHKSDALQSLRLSMPMQETELCKHKFMCSECPLYNPFYSNLPFWCGVFWSLAHVQVFALTPLSVCYLDWRIQWGFHLAVWLYLLPETPIAVFCLTKILCGCFFFLFLFQDTIWIHGFVLLLIALIHYLLHGIFKNWHHCLIHSYESLYF